MLQLTTLVILSVDKFDKDNGGADDGARDGSMNTLGPAETDALLGPSSFSPRLPPSSAAFPAAVLATRRPRRVICQSSEDIRSRR